MSTNGHSAPSDRQVRGLLRATLPGQEPEELRIVVVVAPRAVEEARRRHGTSPAVTVLLGRTLLAGSLLATLTKDEERVTLQLTGSGPIGSVVVDANAHGDLRGYPRVAQEPATAAPAGAATPGGRPLVGWMLGPGFVNVVRDLGLREFYRGQAALESGEVDTDVQTYLCVSEQVPSTLATDVRVADDGEAHVVSAAGVLFQGIPQPAREVSGDADHDARKLVGVLAEIDRRLRAGALWEATAGAGTEHGPWPAADPLALAEALVGDLGTVQVLDERMPRFRCRCTRERVLFALATLSPAELEAMAGEGEAEVSCHFCGETYRVGPDDLRRLAAELQASAARGAGGDGPSHGPSHGGNGEGAQGGGNGSGAGGTSGGDDGQGGPA